jgi:flagellar biosynthesis anti-sigma factor FlgM
MSLSIQNQGQPELDPSANLKPPAAPSAASSSATSSTLGAPQDTASIHSATVQLSADLPIRQDRVDALRAQVESGTYTVNAHAVATAMFQNLFRS